MPLSATSSASDGGMFPKGALVMILVLNAVIFAYNAIELVGITAGEMQNPEREVPKAIRAVVLRIVVFYVGSVTLLAMLLPSDQYKAGTSPFVTVFGQMGLAWMGDVMNMIVITAALSSCNSGLYSIGRIFRTMANNGHAPQWLTKMSTRHVPYAAILAIAARLPRGHPAQHLAGRLARLRPRAEHRLHRRDLHVGLHLRQPDRAAQEEGQRLHPAHAGLALDQLGRTRRPAGHHRADRLRHHDGQGHGEVFPLGLWTLATIPFFALVLWLGWQKVKNNEPKSELFS